MAESGDTHGQASEKERVYRELERTQHKCAELRRQVKELQKATSARENAILRREATEYRKSLSFIAHRLDNGGVTEDELRRVVSSSLLLRGLKAHQRKDIAAVTGSGFTGESDQ